MFHENKYNYFKKYITSLFLQFSKLEYGQGGYFLWKIKLQSIVMDDFNMLK